MPKGLKEYTDADEARKILPWEYIDSLKNFRKLSAEGKTQILLGASRFCVVMFDLECTALKPNIGRIICCSFKPIDGEAYTFDALQPKFRKRDNYDDGALATAIRDELEKYDIIVGHNSKMFDTKFLNARLLRVGERAKRAQYQIDTYFQWKSKSRAWAGLAAIQQFIDQDGPSKTTIDWRQWMRVLGWDKTLREEAMAEIVHHCELDVVVLERMYRFMVERDLVRSIRQDGGWF